MNIVVDKQYVLVWRYYATRIDLDVGPCDIKVNHLCEPDSS